MKTQRDMELFIGKSLRFGVTVACAITVFGGIVFLFQNSGVVIDLHSTFEGAPAYLRSIVSIFPKILKFDSAAIVQFGIICLIATPVLRVVLSLIAFYIEKDKMYVVITAIVLAVILGNMILGIH